MTSVGQGHLSSKAYAEISSMYPQTQIFDVAGWWSPERHNAAMKELGKDVRMLKK